MEQCRQIYKDFSLLLLTHIMESDNCFFSIVVLFVSVDRKCPECNAIREVSFEPLQGSKMPNTLCFPACQ